MFKKISLMILISLISANLAACTPKNQSNYHAESEQLYAGLTMEDIPSWEDYQELPLEQAMLLKVAMEKLPLEECEKNVEQYLTTCLEEEQKARLLHVSLTKDGLSLVEGQNQKPLENLSIVVEAELLPTDDPDFNAVDKGGEVMRDIEQYLESITYTAPLTVNLQVTVYYEYGVANTFDSHTSYENDSYFKEQSESEYAAQTVAYNFSQKNSDFILQKFGAIPETGELYIEYYIMDDFLLAEKSDADRKQLLTEIHEELREQILGDKATESFLAENDLTSLTISFQSGILDDGFLTFNKPL